MKAKEIKYEKAYFEKVYRSRSVEEPLYEAKEKFKRHARFLLNFKKKGRVLDIGFADGLFLHEFDKMGSWGTYGVDISQYAIKKAVKNTKATLKITDLNVQKLPFESNFFDAAYASEVIEHLRKNNNMLKEIHRCLKPGGVFFLTTPNRPSLETLQWDTTCGHINLFNKKRMKEELSNAGFKKLKVKYEGIPGLGLIRRLTANKIMNDEILLDSDWPFRTKKSLIAFGFK